MNTELITLTSKATIFEFNEEITCDYAPRISYKGYISPCIKINVEAIADEEFIKILHNKHRYPQTTVNVEDLKKLIISADEWFFDDATRRLICTYEYFNVEFVFEKCGEYNTAIQYLKEQDDIKVSHSAMNYQNWYVRT